MLMRGWSWPRQLYAISEAVVSQRAAFESTPTGRASITDAADPTAISSDDPFALLGGDPLPSLFGSINVEGGDGDEATTGAAATATLPVAPRQQISLTFGAAQSDVSEADTTPAPLGVLFGSVRNCGVDGAAAAGSFSVAFSEETEAGGAFAGLFSVDKAQGALGVGASERVQFSFAPPRNEAQGGTDGKGAATVQPKALRVPQWVQTTAVATLTGGFVPATTSASGAPPPAEVKIDIVLRAFAWLSSS